MRKRKVEGEIVEKDWGGGRKEKGQRKLGGFPRGTWGRKLKFWGAQEDGHRN